MNRLRVPVSLLLVALLSGCSLSGRSASAEETERSRVRVLWLEGVRARLSQDLSTAVSRFETLARRHANTPQGREAALRAALLLLDPTTPIFGPVRAAGLLTSYLSRGGEEEAPNHAEVVRLQALVEDLVAMQTRTAALEADITELRRLTDELLQERELLLQETARQDSLFLQQVDREVLEALEAAQADTSFAAPGAVRPDTTRAVPGGARPDTVAAVPGGLRPDTTARRTSRTVLRGRG
jgi:hypothetical protein